jgi:NADPH2 dehydrogenase
MGMEDPLPTFTALVERVRDAHPNFAYIHVVEPRVDGIIDSDVTNENRAHSNDVLRKAWGDRSYIAAGGMDGVAASKMVEKYGGLVAFGRHFIANVSFIFGCQWSHFSIQISAGSPFAPEGRSPTYAL